MNFYHAYYKRQYRDETTGAWKDTYYDTQGIIVIADTLGNAKSKIEKCLPKVESKVEYGDYRAVLVSDVVECIGLDRRWGFGGAFEVYPIVESEG